MAALDLQTQNANLSLFALGSKALSLLWMRELTRKTKSSFIPDSLPVSEVLCEINKAGIYFFQGTC